MVRFWNYRPAPTWICRADWCVHSTGVQGSGRVHRHLGNNGSPAYLHLSFLISAFGLWRPRASSSELLSGCCGARSPPDSMPCRFQKLQSRAGSSFQFAQAEMRSAQNRSPEPESSNRHWGGAILIVFAFHSWAANQMCWFDLRSLSPPTFQAGLGLKVRTQRGAAQTRLETRFGDRSMPPLQLQAQKRSSHPPTLSIRTRVGDDDLSEAGACVPDVSGRSNPPVHSSRRVPPSMPLPYRTWPREQ